MLRRTRQEDPLAAKMSIRCSGQSGLFSLLIDPIPIRGILEPNRDSSMRRESMRYTDVSRKEKKCLDFMSLTVEEFEELVPIFEVTTQG